MVLPPRKFFVGLGVQASKETARKLKLSKLLSLNPTLPGLLKTHWTWGGGGADSLTRLFLIVEA